MTRFLYRMDPRTGTLAAMVWAFANFQAFAFQPDVQRKTIFTYLSTLHLPNKVYAAALGLNILLLMLCFFPLPSWMKAVNNVIASTMWIGFGTFELANNLQSPSIAAIMSLGSAVGCSLSAAQWVFWE